MGDYGAGKTHLAASIANDLNERGKDVMFTTAPDLLDYLRQAFDPQSHLRFDKRFRDILRIPILILDDLSLSGSTSWSQEKLLQIIDYRYLSRRSNRVYHARNQAIDGEGLASPRYTSV